LKGIWAVSVIISILIIGVIGLSEDAAALLVWAPQDSGIPLVSLQSVDCTDANTCYVVGGLGIILKTINGGSNWNEQNSGTTNFLRSVNCIDAMTCYAVGNSDGVGGSSTILKTTDGGTTWSGQNSGITNTLRSVDCLDVNTCYAVGSSSSILTPVELFQCGTGTIQQGNECIIDPNLTVISEDTTILPTKKTLCEPLPNLARIISKKVCAFGALRFNSIAKIPNNKT